jgi:LysR family hca operon transcriptional activator
MRELEIEVGAELMTRSAHDIELTAAGKVFLDHARLALAQVEEPPPPLLAALLTPRKGR